MKGKTGKPAMRGGGLARKGVGAALKGGGGVGKALRQLSPLAMAVKGEMPKMGLIGMAASALKKDKKDGIKSGRNPSDVKKDLGLKSGGKVKKMAVGGPAGAMPMTNVKPARPSLPGTAMGREPFRPMPTRPGFPSGGNASIRPMPGRPGMNRPGGPKLGGPLITPGPQIGGPLPPAGGEYKVGMPGAGYSFDGGPMMERQVMKKGGKVKAYAKGGAVKMTAGAGSGSGRLEKVAAHKSAKRIPAQNLKHGGKARGK